MDISRRTFLAGTAAAAAVSSLPRPCAAVTATALDGALPYEITEPGRYVINSNQTVNLALDPAILVRTSNVEIDLQGYRIENTNGTGTVSAGVAGNNLSSVTIHNGELRGFYAAVLLDDDGGLRNYHGHRIANITASNCTAVGFMVAGDALVLSNNTITNPGGSTAYVRSLTCSCAMGIAITRSNGCLIRNNTLTFADDGAQDGTVGMFFYAAADAIVLNNSITGADHGVLFYLYTSGEYRDNQVTGAINPYVQGQDLGHNLAL